MTDPKRWSSPSSEVDPVLRSVLRYGRDLQPDSQQLQAILRGVVPRRPTPERRRFVAFVVAAAAAACAGVAWAGYASFFGSPVATPSSSSIVPPAVAPSGVPRAFDRTPLPLAPPPLDSSKEPLPPEPHVAVAASGAPRSTAPRTVAPTPSVTPSASSEQDAGLLQEARRLVTSQPARALTLTRDHELHFPSSSLTEERQALRIEALARLGRRTDATRELSSFDQTFPRSPYRRRLHTLLAE